MHEKRISFYKQSIITKKGIKLNQEYYCLELCSVMKEFEARTPHSQELSSVLCAYWQVTYNP